MYIIDFFIMGCVALAAFGVGAGGVVTVTMTIEKLAS